MFNNLGIFSANLPQSLRPVFRGPAIRPVVQFSGNNGGGYANSGTVVSTVGYSVNASAEQVSTSTDGNTLVNAMTLTPIAGTYQVAFNANYSLEPLVIPDITAVAAADVVTLAAFLASATGGVAHAAVYGNGEILAPGIYDVVTPAAIQGILTLDGQGDPDAIFVIRVNGALTSVAASQVLLINGANPANVFWRSVGATALGANTVFAGTVVAVGGAASIGNAGTMVGRLLSTLGAIGTNTNVPISVPTGPSVIPVGILSTFALFTASGAVANTGTSTINGDVGTNLGLITGFGLPTVVNGTIYQAGDPGTTDVGATFGVYANGVLVPNSERVIFSTSAILNDVITLQAVATVLAGQSITVRSTVRAGTLTINNRILSLIKVG